MLILTDGALDPFSAKTASCLLRYCPDEVVGLLDERNAGASAAKAFGLEREFPVVGRLRDALSLHPTSLVIGVAPQGGHIKSEWREIIHEAIHLGLDIVSGMHAFLSEDIEISNAAARTGTRLWDVRKPPNHLPVAAARAKTTRGIRVLTMGVDCNLGKMVVSYELARSLRKQNVDAEFIATGQTGIMIRGKGIAIDRVISDFAAGAVEQLVIEESEREVIVIEGQGSLLHPGFSGVTLSLLHGSLPDGVIFCHHPGRKTIRHCDVPIAPLSVHIQLCQALCAPMHPVNVLGIAINGFGLSDAEVEREIETVQIETGLPATDVVRFGAAPLVERVLDLLRREGRFTARSAE